MPRLLAIALSMVALAAPAAVGTGTPGFDPGAPTRSGYRLVFRDEFDTAATLEGRTAAGQAPAWYLSQFFSWKPTDPGAVSVKDGKLFVRGDAHRMAAVQTAAAGTGPEGWRGRAFVGGAYVEARIALGPVTLASANAWPSFWSMSVEHMAGRGAAQWGKGARGYERFIENDFFEYDTGFAGADSYGATLHDWYGIWKKTCPRGFCRRSNNGTGSRNNFVIRLPDRTDWQAFHVVGQLWQPASNGRPGFVQNYFDGKPVSRTEWDAHDPAAPLPPSGRQLYSIMDRHALVLILSSGGQPLIVDWVRVWQNGKGRIEHRD